MQRGTQVAHYVEAPINTVVFCTAILYTKSRGLGTITTGTLRLCLEE
jgi:hypothetical protein